MDVNSINVMAVYAVLLVCLIAADFSYAEWQDGLSSGYDLGPSDYNLETYDRDDGANQNLIGDILKRSLFAVNYRRLPRIKQNRIIPFYSYGRDFAGFKSLPSYKSRTSSSYYVTPWNMDSYRPGNNYNRRIYGSFKRK